MSSSDSDVGVSSLTSGLKQLHPSGAQMAAEAELGIDATSSAASLTAPTQALLAPKPAVIETRAGPVSPKVSPRLLTRSLGGGTPNGTSSATRSPAYSANSSPRGSTSLRGGPVPAGPLDDFPGPAMERRGSGGAAILSNLVTIGSERSLSNSSSATMLIPGPALVRRASKPLVLHTGSNAGLQSLLSRFTVADMQQTRPVIQISSTATPAEGFETLLKNSILSCPVYDESKKEYIGFLDLRDLVSSIVFAHEEQKLTSSFHEQWNELMLRGMQRFGTAVSVTYLSRRNPFKPISSTATLLQAARALSTQLHRLPVVDAEGRCVSIISQSSLVHFLQSHREEVKADLQQTIAQLTLGICKVISVASDASAWQAFKVLEVNSVSGIAIVDRDGKLVGNTSARDLKYFVMNKGNLSLDAPIMDYLAKIRQRDYVDEVHPSCSISAGTSIMHCVGLLAATGYHRVFIVDNGRPIGVVSVTDILRFAAAESAPTSVQSPSNPTTPRGRVGTPSSASSSSSVAGISPSPPTHLRTNSLSNTPIVTPVPSGSL